MRTKLTHTFLGLFMASFLLAQPGAPSGVMATGYDSHVELRWQPNAESNVSFYRIYRADGDGATFLICKRCTRNPALVYRLQGVLTHWFPTILPHYRIQYGLPAICAFRNHGCPNGADER
ncbi:MAG: hypothetical protein ACKV1O_03045 [Saprospiraceae bacterium]